MYESPIELFYQETAPKISEGIDSLICEAVLNVGVNVDKEELLKALQYDRGQYEKGYADGIARAHGEWIEVPVKRDILYPNGIKYVCSACKRDNSYGKPPFCMWCGATMKSEEGNK